MRLPWLTGSSTNEEHNNPLVQVGVDAIYYIKLCVHGVKAYGINRKEALTRDWEELNKETCM